MSLGRIAGPFDSPPFPNLQCSPIGLVPKHEPNSFRLIHHLSFPSGESINDFIAKCDCAVRYTSFDQAVGMVMEAGHGAWMAKSDIKSAFRLLPVSPTDYELLGFRFNGEYYYDKCLPMGCSISCSLFETFSTFLEFKVRQLTQSEFITHYLDDFMFVGSSAPGCGSLLQAFKGICSALGVPIALEKTTRPSQSIIFLGLEIDSVEQQVRVPANKVQALCTLVQTTLRKTKVTLRQIQSLIGSLNFVCRAIAPGRAFTRRLIGLTKGVQNPHHKVRISSGAKLDLLAWLEFLNHFNGVSPFRQWGWEHNDTISLFTDAAASIGFGGYFEGHWFQGRWPSAFLDNPPSIAFLEFYPLVVSVHCWGHWLANRKVLFRTDNSAVVHIINSQSSRCDKIMQLVRNFVCRCLMHNIWFRAVHVPGVLNDIADSLSRFQIERFRMLAPGADPIMTQIPENLRMC